MKAVVKKESGIVAAVKSVANTVVSPFGAVSNIASSAPASAPVSQPAIPRAVRLPPVYDCRMSAEVAALLCITNARPDRLAHPKGDGSTVPVQAAGLVSDIAAAASAVSIAASPAGERGSPNASAARCLRPRADKVPLHARENAVGPAHVYHMFLQAQGSRPTQVPIAAKNAVIQLKLRCVPDHLVYPEGEENFTLPRAKVEV